MSAFVVEHDTIDYLVAAAGKFGCSFHVPLPPLSTDPETLAVAPVSFENRNNYYRLDGRTDYQLIGAMLFAQNVRSVNYRYDNDPNQELNDYQQRSFPYSEVDPVEVLKSIACLRYQSCETPDYQTTTAAYLLDVLEKEAIAHLPGYDDAPWGWTRAAHEVKKEQIRARVRRQLSTGGAA